MALIRGGLGWGGWSFICFGRAMGEEPIIIFEAAAAPNLVRPVVALIWFTIFASPFSFWTLRAAYRVAVSFIGLAGTVV